MIIKIKNLKFLTNLGIYDWEKNFQREIIINAEIHTDFDKAKFTKKIEDTIDYSIIILKIKEILSNKKFLLIEELAQEILDLIMIDERIKKCKIEVDKVGIVDNIDSVSICLEK